MSGPGMAGLCAFAGIPGRDGRPKSVSVNIPSVGVTMTLAACRLFRSLSLPRLFFPTHVFPPLTLPSFPPPHHADDPPFSPRCRPSRRRRRSIHLLPRLRPSLPSIHHHYHPPHHRSPHQHQFVLFLQKKQRIYSPISLHPAPPPPTTVPFPSFTTTTTFLSPSPPETTTTTIHSSPYPSPSPSTNDSTDAYSMSMPSVSLITPTKGPGSGSLYATFDKSLA